MKKEIVLSGVGGQGVVSVGEVMGLPHITPFSKFRIEPMSYGSEARGTFTKTDVIISDGEIGYPNIASPDIILCLAQVAYDRYVDAFRDDTIVFYDSEEVTPKAGAKGEHIGFPYRSEAIALGSIQSANFVALGTMSKKTGLLGAEGCLKAIEDRFGGKKKVVESNQKAFKRGLEL